MLTIDEAMIKFKGRLGLKQFIKNKPTKWGIIVFVLSGATTGYVKRFLEVQLLSRSIPQLMT